MRRLHSGRAHRRTGPVLHPTRFLPIFALALGTILRSTTSGGAQGTFSYYDAEISEQQVVFVIDHDLSMAAGSNLETAQEQTIQAIQSLPPTAVFTVVGLSSTLSESSPLLVPATMANITAAVDFVNTLVPTGSSPPEAGYIRAFEILESSGNSVDLPNPIVLMSTNFGAPSDPNTPATIFAANRGGARTLTWIGESGFFASPFHQSINAGTGPNSSRSTFRRGDVNGDELVNIADAVLILQLGFGLISMPHCRDAVDVAADGFLEPISDAATLLSALFIPGAMAVPSPFPDCAEETDANGLTCYGAACP